MLSWLDDPTYRGGVGGQLNLQESRHRLARKIFQGSGGQLRQAYREGQVDQLSALGLVLNAVPFRHATGVGLVESPNQAAPADVGCSAGDDEPAKDDQLHEDGAGTAADAGDRLASSL